MSNPNQSATRAIALGLIGLLAGTGCFGGRGSGAFRLFEAAVITGAIVSSMAPPPPRIVEVPAPRPGYSWQPGYWTRDGDEWVWVDGQWIELPPNYRWAPAHWESAPDGTSHLVPGHWVPLRYDGNDAGQP